jgi:hypothetical protein
MPLSNEVRDWIKSANRTDLDQLMDLMKLRWNQINAEVGMTFAVGDAVEFDAKHKGTIRGTFMGIKRKNAVILTDEKVQWTVPPGLLRKVT